jgi:hypothetical protein
MDQTTILIDSKLVTGAAFLTGWLGLFIFIVKVSMRIGALELKVDTMWGFQMRRSMSEIVTTGVGKLNSPLVLSDEILSRLDPIKNNLIKWFKNQPATAGDATLLLGIEQHFGDDLFNMVCIPCGLSYGACLIIALVVAKEQHDIDLRVSQDKH